MKRHRRSTPEQQGLAPKEWARSDALFLLTYYDTWSATPTRACSLREWPECP